MPVENMPARPLFITDMDKQGLQSFIESLGQPRYRAVQLLDWAYRKKIASFGEMANLPPSLRAQLEQTAVLSSVRERESVESYDGTRKSLLELHDGRTIETALIPTARAGAYTVCVSSQVGCATGCVFCATGRQGFQRNLSPAEMVDQVLFFARRLNDNAAVSNVVFMGMGEPLVNYADVMKAVTHLNSDWGLNLAARATTISTAGWVPGIEKLSREKLQVGLAVSLHAASDEMRNRLVPFNKRYPLNKLIPACREYIRLTGRRISFEYCLFAGINDTPEQAVELAYLLRGLNCHVNLIPANDGGNPRYLPSTQEKMKAFAGELKKLKINATVRRSYGRDILAACGQLKSSLGG